MSRRKDQDRLDKGARIAVLMGGCSGEHEVSLKSGSAVATALRSRGFDVVSVVLPTSRGLHGIDFLRALEQCEVQAVFLALHGRLGEDGCIQGLLELAGIPYTGSNVLASALAMDKLKAKEMFRLHNVPTPLYYMATDADLLELEEIHGSFGFPVIVKPRSE